MFQLMTEKMTDSYLVMEKLLAMMTPFSKDSNGCDSFIKITISVLIFN